MSHISMGQASCYINTEQVAEDPKATKKKKNQQVVEKLNCHKAHSLGPINFDFYKPSYQTHLLGCLVTANLKLQIRRRGRSDGAKQEECDDGNENR